MLNSSSQGLLFIEKLMWQKDWVRLISARSLKLKKYKKNWVSCSSKLKQKQRGLFRKSQDSMNNIFRTSTNN
jgi:gluconate kinase